MSKSNKRKLASLKTQRDIAERELAKAGDNLIFHNHWLKRLNILDRQIADAARESTGWFSPVNARGNVCLPAYTGTGGSAMRRLLWELICELRLRGWAGISGQLLIEEAEQALEPEMFVDGGGI